MMPLCACWPIVASSNPKAAAISPLIGLRPASTATMLKPQSMMAKSSDEQCYARKRLPLDDDGQRNRVNQRHAQSLRRHGGERADADTDHHGQEDLELEYIHKSLSSRAEKRSFHRDNPCVVSFLIRCH